MKFKWKNSFRSYEYVAEVLYTKTVKVGSIYPYTSGKTIKAKALVGDLRASYVRGKTRKSQDFDNNRSLMITGINNYLRGNN